MKSASSDPIVGEQETNFVLSFRTIIVSLMVVYTLLAVVPLAAHLGWRGVHTVAILGAILLCAFLIRGRVPLRPWFLVAALIIITLSSVTALYWMDARYIGASMFLVFALYMLTIADRQVVSAFISVASIVLLIVLVGAWLGFMTALLGVSPLFEFPNMDGRPNYFYYTTFSNAVWGNVIRPAGVYDEPGTLSFIVCAIAALRHLSDRDSRFTWILLILGFITFSLAHLIYAMLHFMAEPLRFRNVGRIASVVLPVIVVAGMFGGFEILNERLFQRLALTETGEISGDNRSWRMLNAVELLEEQPSAIVFGVDPSCRFNHETCKQLFPLMGENPLAPLTFSGILISWPYYIVVALLLLAPFRGRRYIVAFAFGLLLLQRPNLLEIGFSLFGLLVLREAYSHNRTAAMGKRSLLRESGLN